MICPSCGKEIKEDSVFCTYCGSKIATDSETKKGKKVNKKLIVILAVAVFVLAAVYIVCSFINKEPKTRTVEETVVELIEALDSGSEKKLKMVMFPKKDAKAGLKFLDEKGISTSSDIKELKLGEKYPVHIRAIDPIIGLNGEEYESCCFSAIVTCADGSKKDTYIFAYKIGERWYMVPGLFEAYITDLYINYRTARLIGQVSDAILAQNDIWDDVVENGYEGNSYDFYNGEYPGAFYSRITEIMGDFPKLSEKWGDHNMRITFKDKKCEIDIDRNMVYPSFEDQTYYYGIDNKRAIRLITGNVDVSNLSIDRYDAPELEYYKAFDGLKTDVSWVVTPTIEADEILVSDSTSDEITEWSDMAEGETDQRPDEVAYIQVDGKWGFIGYDGEYIVSPEYEVVPRGFVMFYYYLGDESNGVQIQPDLSVINSIPEWGFGGPGYYYCYSKDNKYAVQGADVGSPSDIYEYDRSMIVRNGIVSKGQFELYTDDPVSFGLAGKYGLLVDTVNDGAYGRITSRPQQDARTDLPSYFTFEKDGRWAYFSNDGKQITDYCYDRFEQNKIYSVGSSFCKSVDDPEGNASPYLPTEGYIAVKTDGKCGYINTEGEEVVPLGTFEDVRPVHNRKAWVKFSGKWGVIELPQAASEELVVPEKSDYFEYNDEYDLLIAYKDVLNDYLHVAWQPSESLNYPAGRYPWHEYFPTEGSNACYAFKDINDDGVFELFVGLQNEDALLLCNVFTLVDGVPVSIVPSDYTENMGGGDYIVHLCDNGVIMVHYSRSHMDGWIENDYYYTLAAGGSELEVFDGASRNMVMSFEDETDGADEKDEGEYWDSDGNQITEAEYDSIMESDREKYPIQDPDVKPSLAYIQ